MVLSANERTFSQVVLESPQPVLVHFWAPWCGLCRTISPLLATFQSEWGEKIKLVGINADQNLKLANAYRLKSLPTLIFFQNGLVVSRLEDFQGREDLRRSLNAVTIDLLARSA